MTVFKVWHWILGVFLLLMFVLVYAAMKMPLSFLFSDQMREFGITDIEGASVSGGSLWISQASLPGLVKVDYVWCPGKGIGSWCVTVENETVNLDAVVTPRKESLLITDADIHRLSSDLLGSAANLFDARLGGQVQEMKFSSYQCPLQHLEQFSAQLKISNLSMMGSSLGDHQIVASNMGENIEVKINGESLDGTVSLADGAYKASGELLANIQIEAMARSFMRSLGANRYGWEINGKIPC